MNKNRTEILAKPFVKWVGGKGQLLTEIRAKYPNQDQGITKYCEPFVGGGAVLFDVLSKFPMFQEILINDINIDLINTYQQIKLHSSELILNLHNLQASYWELGEDERKVFYYDMRKRFNYLKLNSDESVNIEKACIFIFLNKTCFNGLYRVNKQNLFNVPMGLYKKPLICDQENIKNTSLLLQKVNIISADYKECLSFIDHKTFVYIDPPYRPLTSTANFTSYSEKGFDDKEQIELGQFVDKLHALGAKIVISNSDPKNINIQDNFFDSIYQNYTIARVQAKRTINRNADNRSKVSELLISNKRDA